MNTSILAFRHPYQNEYEYKCPYLNKIQYGYQIFRIFCNSNPSSVGAEFWVGLAANKVGDKKLVKTAQKHTLDDSKIIYFFIMYII